MGMVSPEQVVLIADSVKDKPNYWWLLIIGVVPVLVGWLLKKKGK